jgi:hypothetical protein
MFSGHVELEPIGSKHIAHRGRLPTGKSAIISVFDPSPHLSPGQAKIERLAYEASFDMQWLVRRVLVLWLIMLVLCRAVALLVRLNREPWPLQALGFDMCDGEPCWRGIKVGTAWEEAHRVFPNLENGKYRETVNGIRTDVQLSNQPLVGSFINLNVENSKSLPVTAAEIVAQLGYPCGVTLLPNPPHLDLHYPSLVIRFFGRPQANLSQSRLQMNTSPKSIQFVLSLGSDAFGVCRGRPNFTSGSWQGFTSFDTYQARFSLALVTK